jgi:hypothetical protein
MAQPRRVGAAWGQDNRNCSFFFACPARSALLMSGYTWCMHGYTWYIIWCTYMVYTLYIHRYSWIFLAFWNQISRQASASAAGLIQCAHVCGLYKECFIPHSTMEIVPGGKADNRRLNPNAANLSPLSLAVVAVMEAAAVVSVTSSSSGYWYRLCAGPERQQFK